MIYSLFIAFILADGRESHYQYPDKLKYLECMDYARKEMQVFKERNDTPNIPTIEFFCGTMEDFEKEHGAFNPSPEPKFTRGQK